MNSVADYTDRQGFTGFFCFKRTINCFIEVFDQYVAISCLKTLFNSPFSVWPQFDLSSSPHDFSDSAGCVQSVSEEQLALRLSWFLAHVPSPHAWFSCIIAIAISIGNLCSKGTFERNNSRTGIKSKSLIQIKDNKKNTGLQWFMSYFRIRISRRGNNPKGYFSIHPVSWHEPAIA